MNHSASSSQPHEQSTGRTASTEKEVNDHSDQTRYALKQTPRHEPQTVSSASTLHPVLPTVERFPRSARRTPPPPLDQTALAERNSAVSSSHDSLHESRVQTINGRISTQQSIGPHRKVALGVFNRLLKSHARAPPLDKADPQTTAPSLTASVSDARETKKATAVAERRSTADVAMGEDVQQQNDSDVVKENEVESGGDSTSDGADGVLPWWKRILIDAHYRHRLMQLSTEAYRRELKLLRDTPDVISGSAGMGKRRVWRERRWWKDELAEDITPLHYKQDESNDMTAAAHLHQTEAPDEKNTAAASTASSSSSSPPPIKDEVDETVVMSQHVVLKIPPPSTVNTLFAFHHPRSIIDASALETVRGVALGVMPPVQHAGEQAVQEAAIEAHLRSQRRFSLHTSLAAKRRLAKDILAGREDVPMQTAITDTVLDMTPAVTAAAVSRPRLSQRPKSMIRQLNGKRELLSTEWSENSTSDNEEGAVHESVVPPRFDSRPGTPLRVRSRLPPSNRALLEAQHAVNVATIQTHSSALPTCAATPVPRLKLTVPSSFDEKESRRHDNSKHGGLALPNEGEMTRAEVYTQQHRLRCQEAALACTDGTENLYGLQYVWRLPLPPSGFIRVVPDPRYAMWPEDEESKHLLGGNTDDSTSYNSRGGGRRSAGHTKVITTATASMMNNHYRQREMRRLARRVNRRSRKLRRLHEIGRRHLCYNDLALLSDSDASSLSSSLALLNVDTVEVENNKNSSNSNNGSGGCLLLDGNKRFPSRSSLSGTPQLEKLKRGAAVESTAAAQQKLARPIYDGALNINIYAEVLDRMQLRNGREKKRNVVDSAGDAKTQNGFDRTATMSGTVAWKGASQGDGPLLPTKRIFLGCYRQSRLLVHYKMYCRALHEEARVRCGLPLTHVTRNTNTNISHKSDDDATDIKSPPYLFDKATSALLRGVPAIPFPVLRLQVQPPLLREPHVRHTPLLSTITESRCWVGLFPSAKVDLTLDAHQAWRMLRESALVQQALRDIFEDLPHDKEGLLDKRTFVLFVLQLLELFFPTHLSSTIHVAIAEEEWVYRGTTEHIGPHTFQEKFFGFPFIFLRDVAAVTEAELVEFWSILRVCLRAQQELARPRLPGESVFTPPEDLITALHLLVPLTSFSPLQLRALISSPPPAFDPLVYDRFCLLTEAYRSDLVVRNAPRAQQYAVARTRVEQRLRLLEAQRRTSDAAKVAAVSGSAVPTAALTASTTAGTLQVNLNTEKQNTQQQQLTDGQSKVTLSLSDLLSTSAGTTSRIGVGNAVQLEREAHRRFLEAQEKRALFEQSAHYKKRQRHLHERAAAVLSEIECTSSSWELHRTDVYELPSKSCSGLRTTSAAAGSLTLGNSNHEIEEEDVEDALLDYLEDVPSDVFSGRVSLRERYLLHVGYQHRRQEHQLPWLQHRANTTTSVITSGAASTASTTPSECTSFSNTIRTVVPDRETKTRRFLSVMKGEDHTMQERQHLVAAEYARLLGPADRVPTRKDRDHHDADTYQQHHVSSSTITASYAAGMYPLHPVPRTISSIITPSDPRARAHILEQEEYKISERSGHEDKIESASKHEGRGEGGTMKARPLRRTPSRLHTKLSSAAVVAGFSAARTLHPRHRVAKGAALVAAADFNNTNSSSTSNKRAISTPIPPLTAFTPAPPPAAAAAAPIAEVSQQRQHVLTQRVAVVVNLEHSGSSIAGRGKKVFHPSAFLVTSTNSAAASALPAPIPPTASSFISPMMSVGAATSMRTITAAAAARVGHQQLAEHNGEREGSHRLVRPISTVAFLDAASESNTVDSDHCANSAIHHRVNNDNNSSYNGSSVEVEEDGNSTVTSSVLLESSRSFFNSYSAQHTSNASSAGTVLSVDVDNAKAGGNNPTHSPQKGHQPQQQRTGTAARSASALHDTHYACRLRAQQRRQQKYNLQFNSSGKLSSTLKR